MRRHLTTLAVALAALTAPASAHAAVPVPSPAITQTAPYMNVGQPGTAIPSKGGFRSIYFLGDSLTAGIFRVAPAYFPGWKVGINGVGGRPLNDGMGILAATALPKRTILAMGLFTNDLPTRTWALKQAVRESLRRVGPSGCVIWATIHRPAVGGPSWQGALPGDAAARKPYPASAAGMGYAKANAALRALAAQNPNMRLVDWAKSLRTSPMAMEDNDVHPASLSGWQRRAQMYATAARSC